MNYVHAFHAGNFADVAKHVTLVALIEAMKRKEAAFSYLETHAGAGHYDLRGEAAKTGEFRDGVLKMVGVREPDVVAQYLGLIAAENADAPKGDLLEYPGSPLIAARLMRPQDRLQLCETAEQPAHDLKRLFANDPRVGVHRRDGYEALRALLPPPEKRGLILVDPPFEQQEQEFKTIAQALRPAFQRFATGVYAVWYPIKLRQHIAPFHRFLRECGLKRVLVAELGLHPDNSALRLNGCGMAIFNTPYQVDEVLRPAFKAMHERLAESRYGFDRVEWLVE